MAPPLSPDDQKKKREELKSNWKIPAVAQFVSLFRGAFKLPEIEIEDLEEGLVNESSVERYVLVELLIALLRGRNFKTNTQNWDVYLRKLVQKKFSLIEGKSDPYLEGSTPPKEPVKIEDNNSTDNFDAFLKDEDGSLSLSFNLQDSEQFNGPSFWDFDSSVQADILHFLCCERVDGSDAPEAMKSIDADALRAQPLGRDDHGNEYWYFYGTRLYKQEPAPEKLKSWEEEWVEQKEKSFQTRKRGRGRPKKMPCKPRKSDGESEEAEESDANKGKRFMNIDEKSRWSVVCNTIEDWIEFAEKFKGSKSKCEIALFEVVQENFLPALSDIYQEKERRLKQKLKELIPTKSILLARKETKKQNKTTVHDSPVTNEYDDRKAYRENMNRSRASRLEERNRRANGEIAQLKDKSSREKFYYDDDEDEFSEEISDDPREIKPRVNNNRSQSRRSRYYDDEQDGEISEEICDESITSPESVDVRVPRRTTRKKMVTYNEDDELTDSSEEVAQTFNPDDYVRDYFPLFSDDGRDVKKEVLRLIGEVKLNKDAWLFINPVKKEEAPGYYEIISQPIDLTLITQRLVDGKYGTINQLDADFRKLVSNCRLYNGENTGPTKMANSLYKLFQAGLVKILECPRQFNTSTSYEKETSVTVTAKFSRTQVVSKRGTNSFESKKKKRKIRHMDAIEALSREGELAVEKSNSNGYLESLQVSNGHQENSNFSSLKIIPIHSNPAEVIEKFMSESSNQEGDESCHDQSCQTDDDSEIPFQNSELNNKNIQSLFEANGHTYFDSTNNEDDNSNNSVFDDKDNSHSECEAKEPSALGVGRSSSNASAHTSQGKSGKSAGSSDALVHGMANILEYSNQDMSSGFNREPVYSANPRNSLSSTSSLHSLRSHRSDSSSPEQPLNSAFSQTSVVEKHVAFLQDNLSLQSDSSMFSSLSPTNEASTVDASILGFSSISTSPDQFHGKQNSSPPGLATSTVASFTSQLHSPNGQSALEYSSLQAMGNKTFEKSSYLNPVQILKPEANKFPTMKVSLPPSTGEILVVPDKSDPTKMVFHLLAQPHANPSQPIQSSVELRSNGSSTSPVNQANDIYMGNRTDSVIRKSPPMTVQQFPSVSNGIPSATTQALEKGSIFPSVIKPGTTFPNFTTNSYNPTIPSVYANSCMPMTTFVPNPTPLVSKTDHQAVRPTLYNVQSANQQKTAKPPSTVTSSLEQQQQSNIFFQTQSSSKAVNSTTVPNYNMPTTSSKTIRSRIIQKETASNAQRVNVSSNSGSFISNSVMNNGGQLNVVTVPRMSSSLPTSKLDSSDKIFNQNGLKLLSDGVTTAPFYSPPYPAAMQGYTYPSGGPLNPPVSYAQVSSSQPSHFVNVPSYMIANQNMFQHPLNHLVMNVQPFQVPARPVISMDLGNR